MGQGMALAFWCLILSLTLSQVAFLVHSIDAPSTKGYISIDCGIPRESSYTDEFTGLTYVSDHQYIDTGFNHNISSEYTTNIRSMYNHMITLRSFPNFTRNCYTLTPVIEGNKYLVRATFLYGNYDELNTLPTFDIYIGVNFWYTVYVSQSGYVHFYEIINVASADYIQVCLVNTGSGTPFISTLELRPIASNLYEFVNSSQSFALYSRMNTGAGDYLIRYPHDPYDRLWFNRTYDSWMDLSTGFSVSPDKSFEAPSEVLKTAVYDFSRSPGLELVWTSEYTTIFNIIIFISEVESLATDDIREFNIYANGLKMFGPIVPSYLSADSYSYQQSENTSYSLLLEGTDRSTLPPIVNAIEIYTAVPIILLPTGNQDVTAINAIKLNYILFKEWSGDPCVPVNLSWPGVGCTLTSSNIPQITDLNLTSRGMAGVMIPEFGDLTSLKSLNLSNNSLSGAIPSSLDQLTSLTSLDLSGNENLSKTLPPGFQKRKDKGLLKTEGVPDCSRCVPKPNKTRIIIIVAAVVGILLVIALVVGTLILWKKKKRRPNDPNQHAGITPVINVHPGIHPGIHPGNYAYNPNNVDAHPNNYGNNPNQHAGITPVINVHPGIHPGNYPYNPNVDAHLNNYRNNSNGTHDTDNNMLNIESHQFTFNELKMMTNNFQNNIGTGGFGSVFVGSLEKGKQVVQVAVKLRSDKSTQGLKEFFAEAKNLTRVHHKYLVSLVGYCMEGKYLALVYEYMPEGTLQDKLRGSNMLSWKQRLRIAYESAQGLEYLHNSCNPPLVHRDVKTNNILLTANLEAKIADFGLVRAFDVDGNYTHISTRIVGTPGYLDPDYYSTSQLSEKSDVYSFGVVLLEIVTGQSPIIEGRNGGHLTTIVRQMLSKGNIERIIDARMGNQYDINSVWNVAELGLQCTDKAAKRPTMTRVVAELKESSDLENASGGMGSVVSRSTGQYNNSRNDNWASDISKNSGFEMSYMGNLPDTLGPTAR